MNDPPIRWPRGAGPLEVDVSSRPFWDGLREGKLVVPRCSRGHQFFPPMPGCPSCGSTAIEFVRASGRGEVYTWATVHVAFLPSLAEDVPYTVVVVNLEEGGRLMGRLLDDDQRLVAGAPVSLSTYEVEGAVLPGFRFEG